MRAARAAETDLQDQLDAARSSVDRIKQDRADAAAELERAERAVQVAIAAVLEPEARKLLEEARIHRAEYLKTVYAIDAIRVLIPDDIIKQVEVLGTYNAPGNMQLRIARAYDANSSSNALASFRSRVSKPSVNQP